MGESAMPTPASTPTTAPAQSTAPAPSTAPGPARRLSTGRPYIWLWAGIWLIYLLDPAQQAWHRPGLWQRVLGLTAITAFAVLFIGTFVSLRRQRHRFQVHSFPTWVNYVVIGAMSALTLAVVATQGRSSLGILVYVAVTVVFLLPGRAGLAAAAVVIAIPSVVPRFIPGWQANPTLSLTILVASVAAWGVNQLIERNRQLAEAHSEIERLAVADERSRFARDMHDLLGHSLTVVALKAELAGRLVKLDPDRAETEIGDVQRLVREALADVRATVAGYRQVSLAAELVSARTALTAAGIEADLPGIEATAPGIDTELPAIEAAVPADCRELFGWAVREGVTNVVRHSGARHCRVRVTPDAIEVVDDGIGPPGMPCSESRVADGSGDSRTGAHGGHGIAGLVERAAAAGGSVTVGRGPEGGFVLRVHVP